MSEVTTVNPNNLPSIRNLQRRHLEEVLGLTPVQGGKLSYNDLVYRYTQHIKDNEVPRSSREHGFSSDDFVTFDGLTDALGKPSSWEVLTRTGTRPVGQGELVESVLDYRYLVDPLGTNWTAASQAVVDKVAAAGGGTVLFPPGMYMIDADSGGSVYANAGGIDLKDNVTLHIEAGATLKAKPVSTAVSKIIRATGRSNIAITGKGTIDGNRYNAVVTTGEWGYGIAINAGRDITIEDVHVVGCWGDGINLQRRSHANYDPPINVKINNVVARDNRRQGLSVEAVRHLNVLASTFDGTTGTLPACGIDIEPPDNNGTVDHVTIKGCYLLNNARAGVQLWESVKINNIRIEGNTFEGNGSQGSIPQLRAVVGGRGLKIVDNAFRGTNGNVSMSIEGPASGGRIIDNDLDKGMRVATTGIIGSLVRSMRIKGNDIAGTLTIDAQMGARIIDNYFTPPPGSHCIDFTGTGTNVYTKIKDNFFNGGVNGVHFNESVPADQATIRDNTFLHTTGPAIVMKGGDGARIKGNTFEGCCLITGASIIEDLSTGAAVRRIIEDNTFKIAPRAGTTATNTPSWGYRSAAPLQVSYVGDNVISAFGYTFAMFPPDQAVSGGTVLKGGRATVPARATAYRTVNAEEGSMFFDTTLGRPVWRRGTTWVDSTGTVV